MIEEIAPEEKAVEFRLNDGSFQTRYRYQTDNNGKKTNDQLQERMVADVTISFFKDKVMINIQGSTGSTFDGSWGNTGIGTGDRNLEFLIRRLSLSLSPVTGLQVEVGSMAPQYGAGSENSYLDADGYIMGYRARVTLQGDELVVTTGYLGDFKNPSVIARAGRLAEFNYLQVVLTHTIGNIIKASIEYDQMGGDNYVRGAMKIDLKRWTNLLDSLVIEDMVKASGDIFAVKLSKRWKEVIGDKDLQTELSYNYRSKGMDLPMGDKVFFGNSFRATVSIPNLMKIGSIQVSAFIDFIQSITDFDKFRAECGISFKF